MEIEKLDYEPGYKLNITATITDQAIKFENRCMGEALSLWQIKKEDVLARIQEADKLKGENEKLRAELDEKEKYYDQMIDALAATDSAELEQVKREKIRIPEGYALVKLELLEELDNFRDLGPIDRLRELAQADKEGRCVVLPGGGYKDKDGENALKSAMNTCFYHNNPVTRFIADAVAEKLTRDEAALRRDQE